MVPDGWTTKSFAEIANAPISYGVVQTGVPVDDGIPCVRVVDIARRDLTPSEMITTSQKISNSYSRTVLKKDDILIALRGVIGQAAIADSLLEGCNLTRGVARFSPNRKLFCPQFLYQVINTPSFGHYIKRQANGSALQEISIKTLRAAKVCLPTRLAEQEKLAELVSIWDRAIESTKKLIENSERQKKALMQQLLTGKKRLKGFSGEWSTVPLTDVCKVETGNSNREDSLEEGAYTFFDRSTDIRRSNRYLFDTKAIIVGGEGQDFVPKYFCGKFDLHQRAYCIHSFDEFDAKYVYYAIHFKRHILKRFSVGSTVSSLRMGTFTKIPLRKISKKEQLAIVTVLDSADSEIQNFTQKLFFLKQEKTALLQQLLTGKRRVKIDPEIAA